MWIVCEYSPHHFFLQNIMNKEDIKNLIIESVTGEGRKISISDRTEELRVRAHLRRASSYGYEFCLSHLYDEAFYFEKRKEGNKELYLKTFRKERK